MGRASFFSFVIALLDHKPKATSTIKYYGITNTRIWPSLLANRSFPGLVFLAYQNGLETYSRFPEGTGDLYSVGIGFGRAREG